MHLATILKYSCINLYRVAYVGINNNNSVQDYLFCISSTMLKQCIQQVSSLKTRLTPRLPPSANRLNALNNVGLKICTLCPCPIHF